MKKKILIAIFFASIMLILPTTSALKTSFNEEPEDFEILLNEEDEKEIRSLISSENGYVENELNKIISDEGTLKFEELEDIYEDYITTDDSSVIESDSWDWILDRLGWVYITLEQVITIYNDAMALYYEITQGSQIFQSWYQSIVNLRQVWQTFKQAPLNFVNIKNLLNSAIDLLNATIDVVQYLSSQELINQLEILTTDVQAFITFLQSNPWYEPIIIYGSVSGVSEPVTISVKSDSETTISNYNLSYATEDAALSWFVHKCEITASYKEKTITKNRFAFSMGKIEYNIDEEDFNSKVKEKTFFRNFDFTKINQIFLRIFENLGITLKI